jgi:hypothetical protein
MMNNASKATLASSHKKVDFNVMKNSMLANLCLPPKG